MMIFALICVWLICSVITGLIDLWRQINYSKYEVWKDMTVNSANREMLGIFWLCLFVWPIIACIQIFEATVFSKEWFKSAMDRFAKWLFLKLKQKGS